MLKFISLSKIVIAPANTGNDSNNKIAVIKMDQTNNGIRNKRIPTVRILRIVTIKLIAQQMEIIQAICKIKIAIYTA